MELRLDHVIVRTAPEATLAELSRRTGAPVLAPVEAIGAATVSGLVGTGGRRAGATASSRRPPG